MDERPALTTADMLAALGWQFDAAEDPWCIGPLIRGVIMPRINLCRPQGRPAFWHICGGTDHATAEEAIKVAHSDPDFFGDAAKVHTAYDARFPADADRVETSPLVTGVIAQLQAELAAVHSVLRNGADEAVWPPGFTAAEAVARLVRLRDAVTSALQEQE